MNRERIAKPLVSRKPPRSAQSRACSMTFSYNDSAHGSFRDIRNGCILREWIKVWLLRQSSLKILIQIEKNHSLNSPSIVNYFATNNWFCLGKQRRKRNCTRKKNAVEIQNVFGRKPTSEAPLQQGEIILRSRVRRWLVLSILNPIIMIVNYVEYKTGLFWRTSPRVSMNIFMNRNIYIR